MNITAAVIKEAGSAFLVEDIDLDTVLRSNEVLVKVTATGLCHTDIAVRDQHIPITLPAVLGHEGSGIIEKMGSAVTGFKIGDRVIMAPASCGKCSYCISGHPSYCEELFTLNARGQREDGTCPYHDKEGKTLSGFFFGQSSFATFSITYERNLVKVDDDLPLDIMGPLGCGLQTGAGTVINVLKPIAGQSIVVFGIGPVGMAAMMAAKASGCTTIIAVDIHENRLALAMELGATHVINSKNHNPARYIKENILKQGTDYAVDTTARNEVINFGLGSLRPMGRLALVGIPSVEKLEINYAEFNNGKTIEYIFEGDSIPGILIPRLINLYRKGLFPFDKLITFYDLADINKAVADSENGTVIKAVIRMR